MIDLVLARDNIERLADTGWGFLGWPPLLIVGGSWLSWRAAASVRAVYPGGNAAYLRDLCLGRDGINIGLVIGAGVALIVDAIAPWSAVRIVFLAWAVAGVVLWGLRPVIGPVRRANQRLLRAEAQVEQAELRAEVEKMRARWDAPARSA